MNRLTMVVFLFVAVTCMVAVLSPAAEAAPPRRPYLVDLDDPDSVLDVLSRLERSLMRSNDFEHPKRGVDFGLGRGYSGSQAAKHLMGLAAANYAVGPGRKRRDAIGATAEHLPLSEAASPISSNKNDNGN